MTLHIHVTKLGQGAVIYIKLLLVCSTSLLIKYNYESQIVIDCFLKVNIHHLAVSVRRLWFVQFVIK